MPKTKKVVSNREAGKLPPLTGLEAFLHAARAGTFTRAGEALGLSPSALSRRIQALEKHVGEQLFVRGKNEARLTPAGHAYLAAAERALETLRRGAGDAHQAERGRVAITGSHFFMELFVAPHLGDFARKYLDLELVIDTSPSFVDLRTTEFDVAIRYGAGGWAGGDSEAIVTVWGSPCCSPALAEKLSRPPRVDDLANHTLLHANPDDGPWRRYFEKAGSPNLAGREIKMFDDGRMMYAAVAQGLGFALACPDMLPPGTRDLFVFPFPHVATGDGFYFVFPTGRDVRPATRRFCNWLLTTPLVCDLRANGARYLD
ncbi:MAG: LysR family transcriptional regulator [Alphaproteobacteria bacterium]|nr:LysR family transcriptional regulator [Alphaproteobacteria bacterium]